MAPKICLNIISWVRSILSILARPLAFIAGMTLHLYWWGTVLPGIHKYFQSNIIALLLFAAEIFMFVNFFVNMVLDVVTSSKATVSKNEGERYCDACIGYVLKDSWHCKTCNVCIVRREEHCVVMNRCVGFLNWRYHTLLLTYGALCCGLMVSCIIIILFKHGPGHLYEEVKSYVLRKYFGVPKTVNVRRKLMRYLQLVIINLFLFVAMGSDAILHWKSVIRGVTLWERRHGEEGSKDWRKNMETTFGSRWRVALFWPFIKSPLPALGKRN